MRLIHLHPGVRFVFDHDDLPLTSYAAFDQQYSAEGTFIYEGAFQYKCPRLRYERTGQMITVEWFTYHRRILLLDPVVQFIVLEPTLKTTLGTAWVRPFGGSLAISGFIKK